MCQMADIEKPFVNPIDDDECIDEATYNALYYHTLGADCMAGTADDGPRASNYCPPEFEYDLEFCSCKPTDACSVTCESPMVANPLKCGECLTEQELMDLMMTKTMGLDD